MIFKQIILLNSYKMAETISSNILSDIYKLYGAKQNYLLFPDNFNSFAEISEIKENENGYFLIKLEDSSNYLENCLVKKDLILKENINKNSIIKIKIIKLFFLDSDYFFIITDCIKPRKVFKNDDSSDKKEKIALKSPFLNVISYNKDSYEF